MLQFGFHFRWLGCDGLDGKWKRTPEFCWTIVWTGIYVLFRCKRAIRKYFALVYSNTFFFPQREALFCPACMIAERYWVLVVFCSNVGIPLTRSNIAILDNWTDKGQTMKLFDGLATFFTFCQAIFIQYLHT